METISSISDLKLLRKMYLELNQVNSFFFLN
jgi:hypothetical protein